MYYHHPSMCSLGLVRSSSSLLCSWTSSPGQTDDTSSRDTFFRRSPGLTNTVVTSVEGRGPAGRRTVKVSRCPSVGAKHASRARELHTSAPSSRRNSISGGHTSKNSNTSNSRACLTASTPCLASETKFAVSGESSVVTTQLYSSHVSAHGRPVGRKRWKKVPEITSVRKLYAILRRIEITISCGHVKICFKRE